MTTAETRDHVNEVARMNWMDRMFDEWVRAFPAARNIGLHWPFHLDDMIRVDEFADGDHEVIRAEMPGIDPATDVEITVLDGVLHIVAERRIEEESKDRGYTRHELRYGSFSRSLPLPEGASESDIKATYQNGILDIRVPVVRQLGGKEPTKIAVNAG